ncbi:hypothetical protein AB4189_07965, partial [Vibrio sp. 10N.286.49.E1]|uniref:hypothetical protein n=1 Tax=Vibrio sp. 10N.286.49.E1 TaxID=3229702 RepID=UPI00355247D0
KLEAEAKAEAEAEAKAKLEAEAKAEAEAEAKAKLEADKSKGDQIVQVDSKKGDVVHPGDGVDAIGVLGAFKVCAKSDAGFWRSGVQFHRLQEKLVLVVEQEPDASARVHEKDHEPECVVFLSPEKAKRVHDEPHLTVEVVELEDVLDLQFMQQ